MKGLHRDQTVWMNFHRFFAVGVCLALLAGAAIAGTQDRAFASDPTAAITSTQTPTGADTPAPTPEPTKTPTPAPSPTSTPTPGPFVIVIPPLILDANYRIDVNVNNWAESFRVLNAYVDGEKCASVDLVRGREADRSAVLRIGLPGQPPACSREGATVKLTAVPDREIEMMHDPLTVRRGATVVMKQIVVPPPRTGDEVQALPSTGGGGQGESSGHGLETGSAWSAPRLALVVALLIGAVAVALVCARIAATKHGGE